MAQERTTDAGSEATDGWLRPSISEEDARYILDHMEDLEQTQASYLWPLILGMLAGIAVPLGLLFASL